MPFLKQEVQGDKSQHLPTTDWDKDPKVEEQNLGGRGVSGELGEGRVVIFYLFLGLSQ